MRVDRQATDDSIHLLRHYNYEGVSIVDYTCAVFPYNGGQALGVKEDGAGRLESSNV